MINIFHTHVSKQSKLLVQDVLDSGFLNQGKMVAQFEEELMDYGLANVVTTNSCTSALHLAIDSCRKDDKNEVILPAQTFVATGMAVLMAGCRPVFADVDCRTGCIDRSDIEEKITDKTCAIINVHWGGNPHTISSSHVKGPDGNNIPVIEDAAHSFGAKIGGRVVGGLTHSQATFTCFSFQSIKMLTTGDGGAICSWRRTTENIRRKTWFDMDKQAAFRDVEGTRMVDINKLGYKYHMNDVSAAIGLGNLWDVEERLAKRRAIAGRLLDKLPDFVTPLQTEGEPSYWLFTILVDDRKNFARMMKAREIEASVVDRRIDDYPLFKEFRDLRLLGTEHFDKHQISIPCHEGMDSADVDRIIEVIKGGW